MSIVAIVPLSFSPAMDSGATDIPAAASKENISIGISIASILPADSRSPAKSATPPEFILKAGFLKVSKTDVTAVKPE